ncbi:MAG TPA: PAS domain-containing protein [Nitrospirae bacterium]|nr:PAS domain-containing protein [Nitrospirota bacterium]
MNKVDLFTEQTFVLSMLLFMVMIIFLFFFFMRVFRKKGRKEPEEDRSDVTFVVDTFHELVARLKENERELEQLRRRAEDRAEEVESYSDNIVQSVPSGVVSLDNDLRLTKVNNAAAAILRYRPEDIVGKPYHEVFRSPLRELIEKRESLKRGEYLYENAAGEKRWIGLNMSSLFNRNGETIGLILIFTDLTELKSLEKQIRLREWLSSLGEISLGIAHELRNPMAVITGYAKILSRKKELRSIPEVETIVKEINVMDRIIGDFLSFAKPITPNMMEVDMRELIENIVEVVLKERRDIKLDALLKDYTLRSDEVLLRQAFYNLVRNAVEAMPDGGILTIVAKREDGTLMIAVSDTGNGIPEEIRDKVFLPFYTTRERGTGLGLAVVHKNVTLLGGTVNFVSSGEGTTFFVRLPIEG